MVRVLSSSPVYELVTPEDGRWNVLGVEFLLLVNNHTFVLFCFWLGAVIRFIYLFF